MYLGSQAYEWWLNDMYLNVRLPLPIHSNPGMVLPPQEFKNDKDMAKFAAVFIRGVVDHKEKLDRYESWYHPHATCFFFEPTNAFVVVVAENLYPSNVLRHTKKVNPCACHNIIVF